MDTIENLIIAIVKPLIASPDQLTIKIIDGPEFLEYHLDLAQPILGALSGKRTYYYGDKSDCLFGTYSR